MKFYDLRMSPRETKVLISYDKSIWDASLLKRSLQKIVEVCGDDHRRTQVKQVIVKSIRTQTEGLKIFTKKGYEGIASQICFKEGRNL